MVTVRVIPKEEAQRVRAVKPAGVRKTRMNEFDTYVQVLKDNPGQAAIYEGIEESGQKFVLSLRGALKRAKLSATVRKIRAKNEIRAWMNENAAALPQDEAEKLEEELENEDETEADEDTQPVKREPIIVPSTRRERRREPVAV